MAVDFNKIIENDFELDLYKIKYNEVINYLKVFGEVDFWTIIKEVGGSERRMMRLLDEMEKEGTIVIKDNTFKLPNENKKYNFDLDKIKEEMKSILKIKPIPTFLFDQRPITLDTTIKRVKHLLKNNDVYKKDIVFLGDDDLTGICLALTKVDCNITIFDIDERLINFINEIAFKYKLNLKAYVFNVLEKVDLKFIHKFDVLFTDPTPENIPFTIFMNTSIKLVKKNKGVIYTSVYSSAMNKTRSLQDIIMEMKLYISEAIPKFTDYQAIYKLYRESDIEFMKKYNIPFDENSICFYETQFRLEVCDETHPKKITYKGSDVFGKATKRALTNQNNDLSYEDYLNEVSTNMKENENKIYVSGDDE